MPRVAGPGRPAGSKNKKTVEKDAAMKRFKDRVFKVTDKLFESQLVEATGYHVMVAFDKGAKKLLQVTDKKKFNKLLETGTEGKDYLFVVAAAPDYKASDALLNRAFGRPTESVELTGKGGQPMIIKLDK